MSSNKEVIELGEFIIENDKDKEILERYVENIFEGDTYHKPQGLKEKAKQEMVNNINTLAGMYSSSALTEESLIRQRLNIKKIGSI